MSLKLECVGPRACSRLTLSVPFGMPKQMLYRMVSANSTGSWLTIEICAIYAKASGWVAAFRRRLYTALHTGRQH